MICEIACYGCGKTIATTTDEEKSVEELAEENDLAKITIKLEMGKDFYEEGGYLCEDCVAKFLAKKMDMMKNFYESIMESEDYEQGY